MPSKKVQVTEKAATTQEVLPYLPFAEVIADPQLMGGLWKKHLSLPQQVALKAFYGLPLEGRELDIWAVFNDQVVYDELGYPLSVTPVPYVPKEYDQLVGILGRRSGKSSAVTAFAALYEILFGGHLAYVKPGQDVVVPYIAQDLATAKANMIFIALMANDAPLLRKQIVSASRDRIDVKNGIVVTPEPPAIKTGRGIAVPLVIMDEVGFWYRTAEAANPDYEVQRAVSFAQSQFPRAKQFIISTPYTEEGLLYEYWKAGTGGRHLDPEDRLEYEDALVIQSSTAAMENPVITRKKLQKLKNQDPDAFIRESLCRFVSAISGFFAIELVERATKGNGKGRTRAQNEAQGLRPMYVAAMDPAFRHDSFAFAIFHMDPDGTVVQDVLKTWTPDSKRGERLDPATIIEEIALLTKQWGISVVYSDQYQLEALQQLALQHNFAIIGNDFTGKSKAKMYGSLLHLMRTAKLKLLDLPVIYQQLTQLQKKMNALGNVQIAAPTGRHDDVASVIALGTSVALLHMPTMERPKKVPTLFEEGLACLKRKNAAATEAWV